MNKHRVKFYIVAYLPPSNCRDVWELARLVLVLTLPLHSGEVSLGVDCAPPDGGLIHVLVIGHPDVQPVGVIKLTAEGDLTLVMGKDFTFISVNDVLCSTSWK